MQSVLQRMIFLFGLTGIRLLLDDYYALFSSFFEYIGFEYHFQGTGTYLVSWALLWFTAGFQPLDSWKPSRIFLCFLYLLIYIPASSLVCFYPNAHLLPFLGMSAVFVILPILMNISPFQRIRPSFQLHRNIYIVLMLAIAGLFFALSAWQYGISFNAVAFSDVYEVRSEYSDSSTRWSQYAYGWLSKVVALLIFLWATVKRHWWLAASMLLVEFFLFNMAGHKSVFFVIPLILLFYFGIRFLKKDLNLGITGTFLVGLSLLRMSDLLFTSGFSTVSSMFVRRVLLIPAHLFYAYTDYFSTHPHDGFARNFPFSLFMESQYKEAIPRIIGWEYVSEHGQVYANAGIFADAFANAGYAGFFIVLITLWFCLSLVDRLSIFKDVRITVPVVASFAFTMANTGLIVSFITHGFLILIFLLMLLYRQRRFFSDQSSAYV